jgi:Lon protease-like protein
VARNPSAAAELTVELPLFPLHTILFPGAVLPLHIFEQRYRRLVQEKLDFGVVLIRSGREVGAAPDNLSDIGTMATLERVEALPDGRFNVLARGLERFRLKKLLLPRDYLLADVEPVADPPPARSRRLLQLLEQYLALYGLELPARMSGESMPRAVWLAGSLLQVEPLKRQALLESGEARLAESMLAEEIARLKALGGLGQVPPARPSPN